nr:MAG: ORF1 [Torque teno midi virus]
MVWFWRRRRRWPWYRRPYRKRNRRRRYRRRRWTTRRRTTKYSTRNRKRRQRKRRVRKKKTTKLIQWNPESIRTCKIIGLAPLIIGCNGRQMYNYIYWQDYWTHPKCAAGGGFAVYKFSLALLYEDYKKLRNIWTYSNCDYDLCRYKKTIITFYRHEEVDFVVTYTRNPPMVVDQWTYMSTHPNFLLLRKHRIIVPSMRTKKHGKRTVKIVIKPPRLAINKWFFQKHFQDTGLFMLQAAACDLDYSYVGSNSRNRLLTFTVLNMNFWKNPDWAQANHPYTFKETIQGGNVAKTMIDNKLQDYTIPQDFNQDSGTQNTKLKWEKGIFNYKFLNIQYWTNPATKKEIPTTQVQYNPMVDKGKGNMVWFISTLTTSWAPPTTDPLLVWKDKPLWLLLYGLQDYILKAKGSSGALRDYICVMYSKAFYPTLDRVVVIGPKFLKGLTECGEVPNNPVLIDKWFLNLEDQNDALNEIVKSGPFIQNMDGFRCSWELKMKYKSIWQWGGARPPLKPACDPYQQEIFPLPDTVKQSIQIIDPSKQIPEALFHSWDYRRGQITKSAIKRMQENLSDAGSSSTGSEEPEKKKAKRGEPPCFHEKDHSLLETVQNICQKTQETPTDQQLQQLQQQQLNKNIQILKLISELKQRQLNLQLMTGLME